MAASRTLLQRILVCLKFTFDFEGKSKETNTTKRLGFPNKEKATVEQILELKEELNLEEQDCGSHRDPSRKVNYMRQENFDRVYQFYQFHQNSLASPYDGH